MSISATFYLLRKENFDDFNRLFFSSLSQNTRPAFEFGQTKAFRPKDITSLRQSDTLQIYEDIGNFLQQEAKEKLHFKWSGNVMYDLLSCLQKFKNIDLLEHRLDIETCQWTCFVMEKTLKIKYLQKIILSEFDETSLLQMITLLQRDQLNDLVTKLKQAGRRFDEAQIIQLEKERVANEIFPERGAALMEGIMLIQKCLNLVDDNNVIVLHIG